jgi:hypothetical protein
MFRHKTVTQCQLTVHLEEQVIQTDWMPCEVVQDVADTIDIPKAAYRIDKRTGYDKHWRLEQGEIEHIPNTLDFDKSWIEI